MVLRVRKHAVTGHSPFFLLYGVQLRLIGEVAPPPSLRAPLDADEQSDEQRMTMHEIVRNLGWSRQTEYFRSVKQAQKMEEDDKKKNGNRFYFSVGDVVKVKQDTKKFEFEWKGPYFVVDLRYPGTYWLQTPQELRFQSTVNQNDMSPWLAPTKKYEDYFYDGTGSSSTFPGNYYIPERQIYRSTLDTILDETLSQAAPPIPAPSAITNNGTQIKRKGIPIRIPV